MLRHLQIRDLAIIDSVQIDLAPGLTVLTGETGAGKSIMVDALQLLAGGRAGAGAILLGDIGDAAQLVHPGAALRRRRHANDAQLRGHLRSTSW